MYASSIEISQYLMKMGLFRKKYMDYVKISTLNQAADGADIEVIVKAGIVELIIRYYIA